MKKALLLCISALTFSLCSKAQILCIMCFDQNDSISTGINNLISNGGFESHTCIASTGVIGSPTSFCPNSLGYSCDLTNWTCTGGGTSTYACIYDVVTNKSMIQEGSNAVYMGNFYCNPCSNTSGDTSCLISTDCTILGPPPGFPWNPDPAFGGSIGVSIEQTVSGLTVGSTYILEFWAGGEQFMTDPGLFAVNVGFGDSMLRTVNTPPGGTGKRYLVFFNAVTTSHTIKFTNWGHICGNCTELVLDDVRLYTLAELNPSVQPCVNVNVTAIFTAPNHVCPGTCTDFTNMSINGTSYLWSFPGANPSTSTDFNPTNICYNTPGAYSVTLIAYGPGINGSDTLTLPNFITVYPYPPPQGITQSGDTLFANPGAVSYQWYHNGNLITGATNYYYIATTVGNYNVVATDQNNCEVEAAIFDVIAKLDPIFSNGEIRIYPNPANDKIFIRSSSSMEAGRISIYNLLGEKVQSIDLEKLSNDFALDISRLPSSVYQIEIATRQGILQSKFLKQ